LHAALRIRRLDDDALRGKSVGEARRLRLPYVYNIYKLSFLQDRPEGKMTDAVHSSVASSHALSEDWLAFFIGLLVFGLALAGLAGTDLLGWAVTTTVWVDSTKALGTASKTYAGLGGLGALIVTYVALLAALTAGVATLRG
jgi:hypothetical protein